MRKTLFLILFLFSMSLISAQEKLSKEEKERREKNVQAGNPFAKFGSKAPVATLSKGKYLEVHDLDSIVTIGTIRWHVENQQIVGRIIQDKSNPDAQPTGDATGRWLSPDPLSEEFPGWSPYNYAYNNPVRFTDPTGMSAGDYYDSNGTHLGSDGINDNKAYHADSKNTDGTFQNARELSVSNSVLNQFANTVAVESSGNWKESFALASTISNIASSKNKTIENTLKTEGIFGYKDGGSSTDYKNNSKYSMQAVLNTVMGGQDFSSGATKWDGVDFLAWGLNSPNGTPHNKFEEYRAIYIEASIYGNFKNSIIDRYGNSTRYGGISYSIPASVYENMGNWKMPSASVPWAGFMYDTGVITGKSLDATRTYGNTVFWKVIKE